MRKQLHEKDFAYPTWLQKNHSKAEVGKKRTLPTLHGFFNEEGGQEKDFAHPTWLF
jgi:hypothetical protein